jgi:hypothetical protein
MRKSAELHRLRSRMSWKPAPLPRMPSPGWFLEMPTFTENHPVEIPWLTHRMGLFQRRYSLVAVVCISFGRAAVSRGNRDGRGLRRCCDWKRCGRVHGRHSRRATRPQDGLRRGGSCSRRHLPRTRPYHSGLIPGTSTKQWRGNLGRLFTAKAQIEDYVASALFPPRHTERRNRELAWLALHGST